MYTGPWKRHGIFRPKIMTTLRPCMVPLIGEEFQWSYAGSGDGTAYPDQDIWRLDCCEYHRLTDEQRVRWAPDEDIEFKDAE